MYACSKKLGKNVIRGALTNGHIWIFLILRLNENAIGGRYFLSREIYLMENLVEGSQVSEKACSFIAGIVAHWIQHSHEEIGDDDYFVMCSK
jgi:hypothetical protein